MTKRGAREQEEEEEEEKEISSLTTDVSRAGSLLHRFVQLDRQGVPDYADFEEQRGHE